MGEQADRGEQRIICGRARAAAVANLGYTRVPDSQAVLADHEAAGISGWWITGERRGGIICFWPWVFAPVMAA